MFLTRKIIVFGVSSSFCECIHQNIDAVLIEWAVGKVWRDEVPWQPSLPCIELVHPAAGKLKKIARVVKMAC